MEWNLASHYWIIMYGGDDLYYEKVNIIYVENWGRNTVSSAYSKEARI